MTREDIIRMARECGLMMRDEPLLGVERFFHMAQAAEREACAGLVEDWDSDGPDPRDIAAAIRARGQA